MPYNENYIGKISLAISSRIVPIGPLCVPRVSGESQRATGTRQNPSLVDIQWLRYNVRSGSFQHAVHSVLSRTLYRSQLETFQGRLGWVPKGTGALRVSQGVLRNDLERIRDGRLGDHQPTVSTNENSKGSCLTRSIWNKDWSLSLFPAFRIL